MQGARQALGRWGISALTILVSKSGSCFLLLLKTHITPPIPPPFLFSISLPPLVRFPEHVPSILADLPMGDYCTLTISPSDPHDDAPSIFISTSFSQGRRMSFRRQVQPNHVAHVATPTSGTLSDVNAGTISIEAEQEVKGKGGIWEMGLTFPRCSQEQYMTPQLPRNDVGRRNGLQRQRRPRRYAAESPFT